MSPRWGFYVLRGVRVRDTCAGPRGRARGTLVESTSGIPRVEFRDLGRPRPGHPSERHRDGVGVALLEWAWSVALLESGACRSPWRICSGRSSARVAGDLPQLFPTNGPSPPYTRGNHSFTLGIHCPITPHYGVPLPELPGRHAAVRARHSCRSDRRRSGLSRTLSLPGPVRCADIEVPIHCDGGVLVLRKKGAIAGITYMGEETRQRGRRARPFASHWLRRERTDTRKSPPSSSRTCPSSSRGGAYRLQRAHHPESGVVVDDSLLHFSGWRRSIFLKISPARTRRERPRRFLEKPPMGRAHEAC